MKQLFSSGIVLFFAFVIFFYGFKLGRIVEQKHNNDKIVSATSNTKEETQRIKKEVEELRKKLKEKKIEECSFILNYNVKSKCLSN